MEIEKIINNDLKSVSRALSIVENRSPGYLDLLDKLYKKGKEARVIGITGSPGVGKSTLIDSIVKSLEKKDKKVAVIAVDPSSPFTGGAILGDRIRMSSVGKSFFRSVASRGSVGGVSDAVFNMIVVFRAAGYEYIIVETVGVGQNEVSISKLSDMVALVLSPGAGDDIQMMKAGIMEIADLFIVNKSDLLGTDELLCFLKASFTNIVKTSAKNEEGIEELIGKIDDFYKNHNIKAKYEEIIKEGLKFLIIKELSAKADAIINKIDLKNPYEELKKIKEMI
jgi:LAO/AO transport system kinase